MSSPLPPVSPSSSTRKPIPLTCTPVKPSRPPTRSAHLPPIEARKPASMNRLDAVTVQSIRSQYRLTPPPPLSDSGSSPPQGSISSGRTGPPTPPLSSASVSSADSLPGDALDAVFMTSPFREEKVIDQKRTVSFYALLTHRPSYPSLGGNEGEDNVFYAAFPLPPGARTLANGEACLPYSGLGHGKPVVTKAGPGPFASGPAPIIQRTRSDTVSSTSSETQTITMKNVVPVIPLALAPVKKRPSMPSPPSRFAYARRTSFPESCYSASSLSPPNTPYANMDGNMPGSESRDSLMSLPFVWPEGFVPGTRRGSADSQMSNRSGPGLARSKSMRTAKSMHDLAASSAHRPTHSPSASEASIVHPDGTSGYSRSTHSSVSATSRFPRRPSVRSVFPAYYQTFAIEPSIPEYPNSPPSPVPSSVCIPFSQFPSRAASPEPLGFLEDKEMESIGLALRELREEEEEIPTVEGLLRQLSNDSLFKCYTAAREPVPMEPHAPTPESAIVIEKALPPLPLQTEPRTPINAKHSDDISRYWDKRMERRRAGAFTRSMLPTFPMSPPTIAASTLHEDVFVAPLVRPGRSFEIRDAGRASPHHTQDAVRAGSPYGQSVREVPVLPIPRACTSPEPLSEKVKNALRSREMQRSPCSDRGPMRPIRPMRSPSPLFSDGGSVYSMPTRPSLEKASTYPLFSQPRASPSPPGTRGRSGSLSSLDFADRVDETDDTRAPLEPEPPVPKMIPSKAARKLGVSEDTVMVLTRSLPSPSKPSKTKKGPSFGLLSRHHRGKRLEISPPLDTLPEHVDVDPVILYTPTHKSPTAARLVDIPHPSSPTYVHPNNRSSPDLLQPQMSPRLSLKAARSMAYLHGKRRPADAVPVPSNWI